MRFQFGRRLDDLVATLEFLLIFVVQVKAAPIQFYGMNYNTRQGPDWDSDRCKSRSQIYRDLSVLGQITTRIRILSLNDCGQGELVLSVCRELSLDLWLGMWVSDDANVFEGELNTLRSMSSRGLLSNEDAGNAGRILGITVGSEAVYRRDVTANTIVGYKDRTKNLLLEYGLDFPVGIVDVDDTYKQYRELFEGSDVAFANAFPFWERISPDLAADFLVDEKMPDLISIASQEYGKEFILGETGWSSQGVNPSASSATPANQAQYLQDFYCRADRELNWAYYYFTSIDNTWRIEQEKVLYEVEDGVEGHFGLFFSNLTLKPQFQDLEFSCPGSSEVYRFELAEPDPMPSVSPSEIPGIWTSCVIHPQCAIANLHGDCCPASGGTFLGCCDQEIISILKSGGTLYPSPSPTDKPTIRPTTTLPTTSPTSEPTSHPTPIPTTRPISPTVNPVNAPVLEPTKAPMAASNTAETQTSLDPTASNDTQQPTATDESHENDESEENDDWTGPGVVLATFSPIKAASTSDAIRLYKWSSSNYIAWASFLMFLPGLPGRRLFRAV